MGKTYTGVDIGDSSIKLAVCDGATVSKVAIETLPDGLVVDGRVVSHDAMADLIKSVVKNTGGVPKDAAFVVPGTDSLFRRLSLPAMTEKELQLNLPYEFRDYISQGKDRYVYDYAMLGMQAGPDDAPEGMELLAVAAPKQAIADYMTDRNMVTAIDRNALFLSNRRTRISRSTVNWLVKKHLTAAGLDSTKYSAHKLRHTAATLMLQNGVDVRTLQEVLGPSGPNTIL